MKCVKVRLYDKPRAVPVEMTMQLKPFDSQQQIRDFLMQFQEELSAKLELFDGKATFVEDVWCRSDLGKGRTRVITGGDFFEQGGLSFSEIHGLNPPASLLGRMPELKGRPFWGAGVSCVLHPRNPFCPTVHFNYRYFEAGDIWWFGGGADLTPYYPFVEDCQHWHRTHKDRMDRYSQHYYPAFAYWCDEYFFNHHRDETRGIGGIFYDHLDGKAGVLVKADSARHSENTAHSALDLETPATSWTELFAFHCDNARSFELAYFPIAEKRRQQPWTEAQRQFQLYRRGRYVEFNLLHDRGTLFGLQSKGRIESILMSLPPLVRWEYNFTPQPGTPEYELTDRFLHRHVDWLNLVK